LNPEHRPLNPAVCVVCASETDTRGMKIGLGVKVWGLRKIWGLKK